jgi:translocation protein SEC63
LAPKTGVYEFKLHVLSNSYIGLDKELDVELETLDTSALPEYKVHPDDAKLDDEPTLFEEMLNAQNVEEDSDSDDDDDDDNEGIKELSAAERKKMELQKKRQAAAIIFKVYNRILRMASSLFTSGKASLLSVLLSTG